MAVDVLQTETDRQLGQQRTHADALATRAGVLIAVCTLLIGPLHRDEPLNSPVTWVLVATVIFGVVLLCMSRISTGPSPVALTGWVKDGSSEEYVLSAKILLIEANKHVLNRAEVIFWIQAAGTAAVAVLSAFQI